MTADDLFQIAWVSDPNITPDGQAVAFVLTKMDREADDYRSAVWVVPTNEGNDPKRFTWSGNKDSAPRWSPDGHRLAFLSDREGEKTQLYVMPSHGGEARRLTSLPQGVGSPVWSPDGTRVAVVARVSLEEDKNAEKPKHPPARVITSLKYRTNGEGFIYDRRKHIFVVDAQSGETRQLTDGDWDDIQPAWSPDGTRIAFVSARHETRDYDRAANVFVVDSEGGAPAPVTPDGANVALPAWSPDGTRIAYLGHPDAEDDPLNSRLWLTPVEVGQATCLTAALDRDLELSETAAPIWSADGSTIYTGVLDRGRVGLIAVDAEGKGIRPCIEGNRSIAAYSISAAGAIAFVASHPTSPAEVFLLEGGRERALTDFNHDWRAQVELSQPEHFTLLSDGVEIDAWIMRPAGFEPGRAYPTLVNVHGGPFSQYGWAFFDEFQIQAGAGYAVLFCNPRGSSGRDDAFARAIIGAPAEPDSADILAAVDAAIERYPFIDHRRLGLIGGSYGGYLTSWIVGHDHRFAAACSERALNNRFSKEGTSDIWSGYTYLRKRQWEDPELYRHYSPINYVCEIRTPLLILHSEEDYRCPIEQGEQFYTALRARGVPTEMVRFPGESHAFLSGGKPQSRLERRRHTLRWFERYL
jgi:dipeptidyl aminopeptidase/acylaminoacyl peptidase